MPQSTGDFVGAPGQFVPRLVTAFALGQGLALLSGNS